MTCASQYGAYELTSASQNKSNIFNFFYSHKFTWFKRYIELRNSNKVYELTGTVQTQGKWIFWIDQTIFIQHDLTSASQYGAYELASASQNKSNIFNFFYPHKFTEVKRYIELCNSKWCIWNWLAQFKHKVNVYFG